MWTKTGLTAVVWALVLAPTAGATTFTVTRGDDPPVGACNADCSLREAVVAANGNAVDDVILVGARTVKLSIFGTGENAAATGDLDIASGFDRIEIRGAGPALTTIDADDIDRAFHLTGFGDLVLRNLRVLDGNAGAGNGGAVETLAGDVHVSGSVLESNTASSGGATHAEGTSGARVSVDRSVLRGNVAARGGAIFSQNEARLLVTDSAVTGNTATASGGGGIYNQNSGGAVIVDTTISGNQALATGDGGGIFNQNESTLSLVRGTVSGNTAGDRGGGMFIQNDSNSSITETTVSGNRASNDGGGAFIQNDAESRISNSTFNGNVTRWARGRPVRRGRQDVLISNSTISSNRSALGGGGVSLEFQVVLGLRGVTVAGNVAGGAGGGLLSTPTAPISRLELERTLIAGNTGAGAASACSGTGFVSLGRNLSSVAGQCGLGAAGDLGGANAGLGPLAANGGYTATHSLLAASAARDAAGACTGFDQRGIPRPLGAACDIGAFEAAPNPAVAALDRIRPSVTRLGVSPKRFKASRRVRLSLRLSEAARVTFTVERATSGRRRGRRCVKRTRANRNARRCIRYVKLRGSFARSGKAGANSFRLVLRLRGKRLRAASYRIVASARDAAGNRAVAKRAKFRVVR